MSDFKLVRRDPCPFCGVSAKRYAALEAVAEAGEKRERCRETNDTKGFWAADKIYRQALAKLEGDD